MTRFNRIKLLTLIALSGLVACEPLPETEGTGLSARKGIAFSATSAPEPQTKTTYTGDGTFTGTGAARKLVKERIDWTNGDKITIVSPQAKVLDNAGQLVFSVTGSSPYSTADYRVKTHQTQTDNLTSRATIAPAGENGGLQWGEEQHRFYAIYPSKDTTLFTAAQKAKISLTPAQFSATIPTAQSPQWDNHGYPQMHYAWMWATATAEANAPSVNLSFYPQFTAFQFTIGAGEFASVALSSFTLEAVDATAAVTGDFVLQNSSGPAGAVTTANTANKITVNLSGRSVTAATATAAAKDLTFTVLGLPVDMTALRMSFTGTEIGTRTLILKNKDGSEIDFKARRKYRITGIQFPESLTGEGEEIIWDQEAFGEDIWWEDGYAPGLRLADEREVPYAGGKVDISLAGVFQSVTSDYSWYLPYGFEYSADGTDWTPGLPDWITPDETVDFNGNNASDQLLLQIAPQQDRFAPTSAQNPHTATLRGRSPRSNFDLSTRNVATGATVARTTANCYVVDAPGTYRFPVVYGNALKNGAPNTVAYAPLPEGNEGEDVWRWNYSSRVWMLAHFKDHVGADINSPYIGVQHADKSLTARLLWTDAPELITNVSLQGTGQNAEISFSVPAASICQGSAVIAVLADGHIAWSWHIWITDEAQTQSLGGFAPANIGWCSPRDASFEERSCYIRVVQTGTGLVSNACLLTQTAAAFPVTGSNTYYQWGRKDPMPGIYFVNGDRRYLKTSYGPYPPTVKYSEDYDPDVYTEYVQPQELGYAIQRPDYFYYPQLSAQAAEYYQPWAPITFYEIPGGNPSAYWGSYYFYRHYEKLLVRVANLWDASLTQQLFTDALGLIDSHTPDATTSSFNVGLSHVIANSSSIKTVYDPSPAGYRVPNKREMRALFDRSVVWPSEASAYEGKTIGQAYRYYMIDGTLMLSPSGNYNQYATGYDNVGAFGCYWTAHDWSFAKERVGGDSVYEQAVVQCFNQATPGAPIDANRSRGKTNGCPVRPIAE